MKHDDEAPYVDRIRKRRYTNTRAEAMAVSPTKPLTDQQRDFARYWAEGDTIKNALIRAGYSKDPSFGYRLIRMPNIRAVYDEIKSKYEAAAQMTREKVMEMHKEAFDMAKLMSEPSSMVAAAREIGRMCGYYEPTRVKVDLSVSGHLVMDKMNQLSDEELLKIISAGADSPQAMIESVMDRAEDEGDE